MAVAFQNHLEPRTPLQKLAAFQEKIQFEILRRLYQTPAVSKRALAWELGISRGSINFCFQAMVEEGLVKMHNFSQSKNKQRYAYLLTPAGVVEKSRLTADFLRQKVAGYEALRAEIVTLKAEMNSVKDCSQ